MISRRTVLLASTALFAPRIVLAQAKGKIARIGYLTLRDKPDQLIETFEQALREAGWVKGSNLVIEYRWAGNDSKGLASLATELVGLKLDLIVARSTPVVVALRDATRTIPIVMGGVADPVASGFVASLARPGGNITGTTIIGPELAGKRLELIREVVPKLARVTFLGFGPDPAHKLFIKQTE